MAKRKQDRPRGHHSGSSHANASSTGRGQPGNRRGASDGRHTPPAATDPGLLYGRHAVFAALANPRRAVTEVLCTEETAALVADHLATLPDDRRARIGGPRHVDKADLDVLLGVGSVHQGFAARVEPLDDVSLEEVMDAASPNAVLIVLDQVTDPHNIGAILRSAAAFGAEAVVVQDRHTPQAGSVIAKTASGGFDVTPIVRVINLARALRDLQEVGFWCVGLAEEGERTLDEADISGRTALVLGAEGDGLRRLTRETCDLLVRLPTQAPIRSLNVSAAAAIALHQAAIASTRKLG